MFGDDDAPNRFVSGVGEPGSGPASGPSAPPQASAGVSVQAGCLPELLIRGQVGGDAAATGCLVLRDVKALFSTSGGLDISLYSAGMVCVDLLTRMQVGGLGRQGLAGRGVLASA